MKKGKKHLKKSYEALYKRVEMMHVNALNQETLWKTHSELWPEVYNFPVAKFESIMCELNDLWYFLNMVCQFFFNL